MTDELAYSDLPPAIQQLSAAEAERERLSYFALMGPNGSGADAGRLKAAVEVARLRHLLVRADIVALLTALAPTGIRLLFFKGFALAQDYYDDPGARPYGDVDTLVSERDVTTVLSIARRQLGWYVTDTRCGETPITSFVALLDSPSGLTHLDLQLSPVQLQYLPITRARRRFGQAAWDSARPLDVVSQRAWTLAPVDHLLLGLFLNRAYGDRGSRKIRDYVDAATIIRRAKLSRGVLEERARQLSCSRTLRRCLESCDPWASHLDLKLNSRSRKIVSRVIATSEVGDSAIDIYAARFHLAFRAALACAPVYLAARVRILLHNSPRAMLWPVPVRFIKAFLWLLPASRDRFLYSAFRGVWGARRLFGPGRNGCLAQSVALFWLCRARGIDAVFKSGVRRNPRTEALDSHAWVEVDGRPMSPADRPPELATFSVQFEISGTASETRRE